MEERENLIYRRETSKFWYTNIWDPLSGKMIRRSTKTEDEEEAYRVAKTIRDSLGSKDIDLYSLISLYTNPETNPRYKQARADMTGYSKEHAYCVANYSKMLIAILQEKLKPILRMKVVDLQAIHVKRVKMAIIEEKGHTRGAQNMFMMFKVMLSQAHEDCIIESSPGAGMKNIAYKVKTRDSVDADILYKAIAAKDQFLNVEEWAYFTILATTGMRRSEALAMTIDRINDGVLTIDQSVKSNRKDDIGLPKRDKVRVIPLAEITKYALSCLTPNKRNGRYFDYGRYWTTNAIKNVRCTAAALFPEDRITWERVTAHVLRHSLNTNLQIEGGMPSMVATYLSWDSQELGDMQKRYTHMQGMRLIQIANIIDEMFPLTPAMLQDIGKKKAEKQKLS